MEEKRSISSFLATALAELHTLRLPPRDALLRILPRKEAGEGDERGGKGVGGKKESEGEGERGEHSASNGPMDGSSGGVNGAAAAAAHSSASGSVAASKAGLAEEGSAEEEAWRVFGDLLRGNLEVAQDRVESL